MITAATTQPTRKTVLELLRDADETIDRIVGTHNQLHNPPKIERNTLNYHITAIAGILRRTNASSITCQVGHIIVEARRIQ